MAQSTDGVVKFPKALQLIRYEDTGRRRDSAQNVMQDLVLKWGSADDDADNQERRLTATPSTAKLQRQKTQAAAVAETDSNIQQINDGIAHLQMKLKQLKDRAEHIDAILCDKDDAKLEAELKQIRGETREQRKQIKSYEEKK